MRLLVDTNLFIEVLLNQSKAGEARAVLDNAKRHGLYISDFALHSIGVLLFRHRQHEAFHQFLEDIARIGIRVVSLTALEMHSLGDVAAKCKLDFDDAYQYGASLKHGLEIVSFDADFDRTAEGRLFPADVV
jgi:hypothetical protein